MIIEIYILGIILWPIIWYLLGWKNLFINKFMYLPFALCIIVLLANSLLNLYHVDVVGEVDLEESLFRFLDQRASNIISGISSLLVISAIVYGVGKRKIPHYFLRFISASYISILGFMTPLIWIPLNKAAWLTALRAFQTVPFTYGIYFALAAIIILLNDIIAWLEAVRTD